MKPSTKRILTILTSFFFIIGALIVFLQFIKPVYGKIQELRGEIRAKTILFSEQRSAVEQIDKLLRELEDIGRLQETLSFALPLKEEIPQVINQYQAIARASGVVIEALGLKPLGIVFLKPEPLIKGIGALRFNLKISGSYQSLKNFFQALETNIRISDLVSLKMETGLTPERDFYILNVEVDTYYQAE